MSNFLVVDGKGRRHTVRASRVKIDMGTLKFMGPELVAAFKEWRWFEEQKEGGAENKIPTLQTPSGIPLKMLAFSYSTSSLETHSSTKTEQLWETPGGEPWIFEGFMRKPRPGEAVLQTEGTIKEVG